MVVGVQIAFAFCLVTTGAAFVYSLMNLTSVDVGFDPAGVTVLTVANALGPSQRSLQLQLTHDLQSRVAALPGIRGAATAWYAMFSGSGRTERVVLPGQPPSERAEVFYRVSPGYLSTLSIRLLGGRDFDVRDNDNEPVPTIVNRSFAMRYFGTESVLGREFARTDGVRHQIVGVAGDSRYDELRDGPEPIAYMPMKPPNVFTLYVRSTLDPGSVQKMVAREAAALGSGMRVRDVTTLDALVGNALVTQRLLAAVGGACACLGLLLSAIGLFGLLNHSVAARTREIGIRTALGARRFRDLRARAGGCGERHRMGDRRRPWQFHRRDPLRALPVVRGEKCGSNGDRGGHADVPCECGRRLRPSRASGRVHRSGDRASPGLE